MMQRKFSTPRGTNDILPEEIHSWQQVDESSRRILSLYGYREIRTPIFEETELFSRSVGQTSDIVQKQMLNLAAQGDPDTQDLVAGVLSLRPEGTASIVRAYIQNNLDKKEKLSKFFYIGPMFRGERPQKGRLRQFHQVGVEAIGPDSRSPYLDAEVIGLCVEILNTLGLKNFQVKLNTLGSSADKENFSRLIREELRDKTSHLCADCQKRFERNVFRILDCKNEACKTVVGKLSSASTALSEESRIYFQRVQEALNELHVPFEVAPYLVRGLDYYTDTVFEITQPSLGSQDALGAGGRYNNLVSQLGGPQVDAVGFALGIERLLLAIGPQKEAVPAKIQAFVAMLEEPAVKPGMQLLKALRCAGISCEGDFSFASIKSQMRLANKAGAKCVMILGPEEVKVGKFTVKNMATGEQMEIRQPEEVVAYVQAVK